MNEKAVVLLSGGQDSATCLALAMDSFRKVYAVSFDYGQRHRTELQMAKMLARMAGAEHVIVPFPTLAELDQSSTMVARMGDARNVSDPHPIHKHLPSSFLPGRNYMLLGLAAVHAFNIGAETIFTGVCQEDMVGYPDCRRVAIDAIENALRIAMEFPTLTILTPLMFKTKAETVKLMVDCGRLHWYAHTQTCYNNKRPPCGNCSACSTRAKGFAEAGVVDPLLNVGMVGR